MSKTQQNNKKPQVGVLAPSPETVREILLTDFSLARDDGQSAAENFAKWLAEATSGEAAPAEAAVNYEQCGTCGGAMRRESEMEYVCTACGSLVEGDSTGFDDDGERQAPTTARLRIVGAKSSQLQPDLFRSGTGATPASQCKAIFEEFKIYRQHYIEAGGPAFPLDVCQQAADYYTSIQSQFVKRSQSKKKIMASCIRLAGIHIGFAPTRAEIAKFMQLPTNGIAQGDNFILSLVADGRVDIEMNRSPCRAEINTLFGRLGYDGDEYKGLRDAVHELVTIATDNHIGTSSVLRSKVAGATYLVLSRCRDRSLIPKAVNIVAFCTEQAHIRKNTIERFTRQVDSYHSYFVDCYKKYGLSSVQ
jgi:transcription initiation factor TFIIIB Brf1 subunit/transcription initiation factor TFIIB